MKEKESLVLTVEAAIFMEFRDKDGRSVVIMKTAQIKLYLLSPLPPPFFIFSSGVKELGSE